MSNTLERVVRYAGDVEYGMYWQALKIQTSEGMRYILLRGRKERDHHYIHEKVEMRSEQELVTLFPGTLLPSNAWRTTDAGCGYDITPKQFQEALRAYRENNE